MNLHIGVVEDRDSDPLKLGRCRVRVSGLHTEDKTELPTQDLPWFSPIKQNSAAMSGIGDSPLGYVEGTVVIVSFMDAEKQHGIILGSIAGIPTTATTSSSSSETTQSASAETTNVVTAGSGGVVTDSSGNPIQTSTPSTAQQSNENPRLAPERRPPRTMQISQAGIAKIKEYERLSSLRRGQNVSSRGDVPANTQIFAYQDSGGVWTIGWGNTFLEDGTRVGPNTVLTKAQCDALFEFKLSTFVSGANSRITVPVTQSMFDAVVSMMYNAGVAGIGSSSFMSTLNSGRYREAATLIVETRSTVNGQPSRGLRNRREAERQLFIRDGFLDLEGNITPPPTTQVISPEQRRTGDDRTRNPVIRRNQDLRSQDSAFTPQPVQNPNAVPGFQDPNGRYPRENWIGEPDLHRLARHEDIENTIVFAKDSSRAIGVQSANGTWDQPPIPYNAKYPFNTTRVSQSGHVEEWDDTPGNERLHRWHRSGTYEEIDVNGTMVRRIMGDDYEILERNGKVLIRGSCDVTVKGNSSVRIENNATVQILGNCSTSVTGNYNLAVGGKINIKAGAGIALDSDADIDILASGQIRNDGSQFHMNTGNALGTGIEAPSEAAPGVPEFSVLTTPQRSSDIKSVYELPEDGDPTEFLREQVNNGSVLEQEVFASVGSETASAEVVRPTRRAEAVPKNCDIIFQQQEFTSNFRLTENFTLGQVCQGRSGIPRGINYGLTAQEIVCNLKTLTENVIEPIAARYPGIVITNTFRSQAVNDSLRGASRTSAHLSGQAVDFIIPGFTRKQLWQAAKDIQVMLPSFDQMLLEYLGSSMWIHISYKATGNRNEIRTIVVNDRSKNASGRFVLYE